MLPDIALHVSAKRRHAMIDAVVTANGLQDWLVDFTARDKPDANRQWFMEKLWVKGLPRVSQADVQLGGDGVEALLARLDAGEHAAVVPGKSSFAEAFDVDGGGRDE